MRAAFPTVPALPLGRPVAAYVEAHIEQGPILEREGFSVGVVTGIQGKRTFRVTVRGIEAHAGTSRRTQTSRCAARRDGDDPGARRQRCTPPTTS